MSSLELPGRAAASGGLFVGLIDDAAVFPPGSATLPDAVDTHRRLRQSPACTSIGPLLLPASAVPALLSLLEDPAEPLAVSLVGRPGEVTGLIAAKELADRRPGVTLAGLEIAVGDRPIDELVSELADAVCGDRSGESSGPSDEMADGPPARWTGVALEISRDRPEQFTEISRLRARYPQLRLRGKYRTGGVDPGAVPTADELAAVIVTAVRERLPIKLTAGLHHAVRGGGCGVGAKQHGVLNVLLAVRQAFSDPESVAGQLERADPNGIAGAIRSWTELEVEVVRAIFTAFGCCGVLEPLTEAAALGVVEPVAHDLIVDHEKTTPPDPEPQENQ